ncbi:MAG: hypothetical protein U0840_17635 [Gemmataceae bacterium]
MVRFLATCVLLAAACVTAVVFASDYFKWTAPSPPLPDNKRTEGPHAGPEKGREAPDPDRETPPEGKAADARPTASPQTNGLVRIITCDQPVGATQPLVIQDGRVLPFERQEVPSERDGKLLLLATPVSDEEFVQKDKEIRIEVPLLGVEWKLKRSNARGVSCTCRSSASASSRIRRTPASSTAFGSATRWPGHDAHHPSADPSFRKLASRTR